MERQKLKDSKNEKKKNEKILSSIKNNSQDNEKKSTFENKENNSSLESIKAIRQSIINDKEIPEKAINAFNILFNVVNKLSGDIQALQNNIQALQNNIRGLQNNNDILMNNQKKLWNYLNLLANGRDMIKSIIFYLYNYFGLKGENETFKQLERILAKLKTDELDSKLNGLSKSNLIKFLNLLFFFKNFFNKVLHREFAIQDIQKESNNESNLKIMSEYSFISFFKNLEYFFDKTIKESDIQKMIDQANKDYINDNKLPEELKYMKGKIFEENGDEYKPTLNKLEINSVFEFLDGIVIGEQKFGILCENKIWKKDDDLNERVPTPVFYNSNKNK